MSAGAKEEGEDAAHFFGRQIHAFRMPLYAKQERVGSPFDGFGHTVRSIGTAYETGAGCFYSLMVETVDPGRLPKDFPDHASFFSLDRVGRLRTVSGRIAVVEKCRVFG